MADSLKEAANAGILSTAAPLDYVAHHTPPGLPPHCLHIKTKAIYRLMHNFFIDCQLVKNVRVMVTEIRHHIITIRVLRDTDLVSVENDKDVIIP